MKKEDISKFIYWTIMPMAIGFVMFFYLDKMEASLLYKALIFLVIAIPLATIRVLIGVKLFKEKPTLAEKMMSCSLRRKYGNDYCARCSNGYECASGIEKNDIEKK